MRGAPAEYVAAHVATGIIPAYAGSTTPTPLSTSESADHPRVCGEHTMAAMKRYVERGSSPRMRGAPRGGRIAEDGTGIIPAYAGSTMIGCLSFDDKRDHPRVCGEHPHRRRFSAPCGGSSPRMRGAPGVQTNFFFVTTGSSPRMRGAPAKHLP